MSRETWVRIWQALRRMLIAAVVGLVIGGAIWFHEAKGATAPKSHPANQTLVNAGGSG